MGHRWRSLFNRIHYRPERETFHEFLGHVVKWTFGEEWWAFHSKVEPKDRHAAVQWCGSFCDLTQKSGHSASATGAAWEWLQLGYDLFCLQEVNKLPDFLVERMKARASFQSARYEIRVASILLRAGFSEIDYLDDKDIFEKHCEFFARDPRSGVRVAVEAKSRIRPGAVHEPGPFSYTEDFKGIQQLYRRAKDQRPPNVPFFIFLDMNLPPTPDVPIDGKPWFADLKRTMGSCGTPSRASPDPFTAVFATNLSNHYVTKNGAISGEWTGVVSKFPEIEITPSAMGALMTSVDTYYRIPSEV